MRTDFVELAPEVFDQDLRINPVLEPLHRQTLIAELAVEGFIHTVLPGLARIDQLHADESLGEGWRAGSVVCRIAARTEARRKVWPNRITPRWSEILNA